MNTSARLEDFQFIRGDPRPFFHNFIMSHFKNIFSIASVDNKFDPTEIFRFVCTPKGRRLFEPNGKGAKRMKELLEDANVKLILFPVLLINKYNCLHKGIARHINFLLYNKITHEVERIDIRRYHLSGFSLKLFIKRIDKKVIQSIITPFDEKARLITDLDVPLKFVSKLGFEKALHAFPQFLLTYLKMRNMHVELTREEIIKKTMRNSTSDINKLWTSYVEFRENETNSLRCKEGLTVNPETHRCVRPLSLSYQKHLIEKPRMPCQSHKQYNSLLGKCVLPHKMLDVNIMLEEILTTETKRGRKVNIVHVDAVVLGVLNFFMRKYPHAMIISPLSNKKKSEIRKADYCMIWKYNKDNNKFDLKISNSIWENWSLGMANPAIRFIVCFVNLYPPNGVHANVLIHDKDTNEIERFDGLGRDLSSTYQWKELDAKLQNLFASKTDIFPRPIKYYSPLDYCPKMPVFQSKEIDDIPGEDLRGNCAVWRLWYIDTRLANPHLTRKQLVEFAAKKMQDSGSLYRFIKGYQRYILSSAKQRKLQPVV